MSELNTSSFNNLFSQTNSDQFLTGICRGIEKESLRVCPQGKLATSSHPQTLGSALTHPHITTDFAEALLEFITPAQNNLDETLGFLDTLHRLTCKHIPGENLWAASMPCILESDEQIPVAHYGNSHSGQMKSVYRVGLGHRYGRLMQTIAGIHYNFSMPQSFWQQWHQQSQSTLTLQDFITDKYFGLIRNFRRLAWLPVYLFGASPAVCKSFLRGYPNHQLDSLDNGTCYAPYGTSLRMGDLGYQSNVQSQLDISYNSLQEYAQTLRQALSLPHPPYEKIGTKKDGTWQQLNTSVLQIENEFYNWIRPKRTATNGERPVQALEGSGVEYIEVRCLDLDPWQPIGIGKEQSWFLDQFLIYCLLSPSPEISAEEASSISHNVNLTVREGRKPDLMLNNQGQEITLTQWADKILNEMQPIAIRFDQAFKQKDFSQTLKSQQEKVANSELTPSAKILQTLNQRNISWFTFAMEQSQKFTDQFSDAPIDEKTQSQLNAMQKASLEKQHQIEANDTGTFDEFLIQYFLEK